MPDRFDIFEAARMEPDRDALVVDGRPRSYREAADEARRAAAWLAHRGAPWTPDDGRRVLASVTATASAASMVHALVAHGIPTVMVHPRSAPHEQDALQARTRPELVVDPRWSDAEVSGVRPPEVPVHAVDPARTLAVFFTSGTTGRPKGAVLTRGNFLAAVEASERNLGWHDDDRWLLSIPPAHVGGYSILLRCLAARRAVVIADGPDPEAFIRHVKRDQVTLASLVPTQLVRLLDRRPAWDPPPSLRAVLLGGAAAPEDMVVRARARGWNVLRTYGSTEAASQVATEPYRGPPGPPGTSGRPVSNVEIRIRDDRVWVRGPNVMARYLDSEDAGPDHEGWFDTGDHGAVDADGWLRILGRRLDLIVTGGENVYPVEVEAVLQKHPGVADVLVCGVSDAEWGQVVGALVVPASAALTPEALDGWVNARLGAFKRPRRWLLVEALPIGGLGKPDRRAAQRMLSG